MLSQGDTCLIVLSGRCLPRTADHRPLTRGPILEPAQVEAIRSGARSSAHLPAPRGTDRDGQTGRADQRMRGSSTATVSDRHCDDHCRWSRAGHKLLGQGASVRAHVLRRVLEPSWGPPAVSDQGACFLSVRHALKTTKPTRGPTPQRRGSPASSRPAKADSRRASLDGRLSDDGPCNQSADVADTRLLSPGYGRVDHSTLDER
jgi:hypothetical protein